MPPTTTILVCDANQRSALATTRSLGKEGNLYIICTDTSPKSLAGSSTYCHQYLQCPCPRQSPKQFIEWLSSTIHQQNIDCLFPMTEITSQLILMNRDKLTNCELPFAGLETVMTLANKAKLTKLAAELGIPYPYTDYYKNSSFLKDDRYQSFPIVLKPDFSHLWKESEWVSTSVNIIQSRQDLAEASKLDYLQQSSFMIQDYIPGHGAGVFALYNHGKAIAFFSHERLREKPPRGGVSVLSRSTAPDANLVDMSKRLLDAVNWHGVAMIEYRIGEDGTAYLMEVNTRFWGSLQLSIDAGVNFPMLLWQTTHQQPKALEKYTTNQKLRWLLGDVDSLYIYLKDENFSLQQKLKRVIDFFTPDTNTRHEVNRIDDLGPAWFELKTYIKKLIRK